MPVKAEATSVRASLESARLLHCTPLTGTDMRVQDPRAWARDREHAACAPASVSTRFRSDRLAAAERAERGRAETASPSRAPAARGLRNPHPASAPRWPRDRCGNLRASTTTAHEQRREHAVHVTGTTRSPASLERVISPGSRHASAHLLDRRTWCVAREPCGAAAHTSRHNSYTCPMTSPEKWSTQGHTVRFFSTASSRLCCYEALWDGGCLRDVSEMKSHRVGAGSCSARR